MCGIAGLVNLAGARESIGDICRRMTDVLVHRGPDAAGCWQEGPVALGHRRLAIVDLTAAGAQPMLSACGRYALVFNGEIYNCPELRDELESTAYFRSAVLAWRGHSDTEVLLAAIAAWGIEVALRRSVGMFAIALWDRREQELCLARDRLGEKPLYYGYLRGSFVFASELKALRRHPDWQGSIDRDALAVYLRHNYLPAPLTIHEGVHKLPPGTLLRLSPAHREPGVTAYWSLRETAEQGLATPWREGAEAAEAELERLLGQAVAGQMLSDVPLGAFLSGGIDSSCVVALMQARSSMPVRTFSIGFAESGFDEAPYARAVAAHLGTEHCELYVTAEEALAVIEQLPTVYDEPFADSSQVPTLLLSRLVRKHVTVALSGDGGDELLGGYDRYPYALDIYRRQSRLPRVLRRTCASAVSGVSAATWDRLGKVLRPLMPRRYAALRDVGAKAHKLAGMLRHDDPVTIYRDLVSHWGRPAEVLIGAREKPTVFADTGDFLRRHGLLNTMLYLDYVSYLPDDILVKVDRAGMAASLETRMPFLDHRLIEFAWRLPPSMKLSGGTGKWLLRRLLARHIPAKLFERPKMGFGIPLGQWLCGPLREWAESLLDPRRLRQEGYFDGAAVRAYWESHLAGRANWQYLLWDVLMFQAWLERNQ
ncbi:MAG: asparagine synthetase [Rhodocyclaceae bacterium]|nr:asparagine synthetase [Rhodocyclaceae bacterium]